jgi:hypothetical protein
LNFIKTIPFIKHVKMASLSNTVSLGRVRDEIDKKITNVKETIGLNYADAENITISKKLKLDGGLQLPTNAVQYSLLTSDVDGNASWTQELEFDSSSLTLKIAPDHPVGGALEVKSVNTQLVEHPTSVEIAATTTGMRIDDTQVTTHKHIIPYNDAMLDLGSPTNRFRRLYGTASEVFMQSDNTSGTFFPVFTKGTSFTQSLFTDPSTTAITYNPATGTLTCPNFTGLAASASAVTATASSLNTNQSVAFLSVSSGSANVRTDTAFTYNPSTDVLNVGTVNASIVGSFAGNTQLRCGATNSIEFSGAALLSTTSGGSSGQHLTLTINGTVYKIKLENV